MSSIISIPRYEWTLFSRYPKQNLDLFTSIAKEIMKEAEDPSFDHNNPDCFRKYWDHGDRDLRSFKRIIGKIINQSFGYDYIGQEFPGLVELSEDYGRGWDDGLEDRTVSHLKFNKETHEITTTY
jgi:hypothetical protein